MDTEKKHDKAKKTGKQTAESHHKKMADDFKRRFFISIVITVPVLLLSPLIQEFLGLEKTFSFDGSSYVLFGLSTLVYIYGGYPFLKGLYKEISSFQPGMMTLIALAITVAYIFSGAVVFGFEGRLFFWELVTLIDIMLLGHWVEMKSVMSASGALKELAELLPDKARRKTGDGKTEEVNVDELENGDTILVKPGEKIAADGVVESGESTVDEAMVTGESEPVYKDEGSEVVGGTINNEGSLTITVKNTGQESYLSKVVDMVKKAQESKSKTRNLADRAAMWLTVIALSSGLITYLAWVLFSQQDFTFAVTRAVTVMVITCPHALGLAVPLVVAVSTAITAKNGVLIRDRTAFENARNIDIVIFDKTGTLTQGEFGVAGLFSFSDDFEDEEILSYAASVEQHSEHPIARGILEKADKKYDVEDFSAISGKGAKGKVKGKNVAVMNKRYLDENDITVDSSDIDEEELEGKTLAYVIIDDTLAGLITLEDRLRDDSENAVKELKNMGITPMMITGDNETSARIVAEKLGIEKYFAEVLPDKKAEKVKEVKSEGKIVAMTGDGINDAPALAEADIGIAVGTGTDVAAETADIVLVKSNPKDVIKLLKFSRATHKKLVQNLFWATGYNAVAIPLAAGALAAYGVILSPAVGAILMSLSTVIVAVNAKLLKA